MCADCDGKRAEHLAGDCPPACSLCADQVLVVERGDRDDLFRLRVELPSECGDGPHHLALVYRHGDAMLVLTRQFAVVSAVCVSRWPRTLIDRAVTLLSSEWERIVDRAEADSESTEQA